MVDFCICHEGQGLGDNKDFECNTNWLLLLYVKSFKNTPKVSNCISQVSDCVSTTCFQFVKIISIIIIIFRSIMFVVLYVDYFLLPRVETTIYDNGIKKGNGMSRNNMVFVILWVFFIKNIVITDFTKGIIHLQDFYSVLFKTTQITSIISYPRLRRLWYVTRTMLYVPTTRDLHTRR